MGSKRALFNIKGMSRDLAASKFSPEFAYENMNLRLVATDDNTSLALTNEKGTAEVNTINWDTENLPLVSETNFVFGTPIGQQVLNDNLILFTAGEENEITLPDHTEVIGNVPDDYPTDVLNITSDTDDNIYKFWFDDYGVLNGRKLFQGDLHFRTTDPIECIGVYENEGIQKVYWTDGINPPRVINAASDAEHITSWDGNAFNFVNNIKLRENVTVTRDIVAAGSFAPGTIQYVFTYYKLYGQETNIFHTSPLLYTSYVDRGASPDDTVSNSFTITLSNLDTRFDYVRIYSVLRTSLDSTPQVRQVVDLEVPNDTDTNPLVYVDTGIGGSTVDITKLLYIGGEEIIVGTLSQKDNTLFLGNIKYNKLIIPEDIQEQLRSNLKPSFAVDTALNVLGDFGGYYNYTSQLGYNSREIKGFKFLEWYRFGLQFQYKTGKWSDPVWIGDVYNGPNENQGTSRGYYPGNKIFNYYYSPVKQTQKPYARKVYIDTSTHIFSRLVSLGYLKMRPVVVYPTIGDREVICQGILCPTVYNVKSRIENAPFAQSSWFARANAPFDIDRYDTDINGNIGYFSSYNDQSELSLESRSGAVTLENKTIAGNSLELVSTGSWLEFRHNTALPDNLKRNCEVQCNCVNNNGDYYKSTPLTDSTTSKSTWKEDFQDLFYVDQSIITLHSPEIEFNNEISTLDTTDLKLRIIGIVPLTAFSSNIDLESSTLPMNHPIYGRPYQGFYSEDTNMSNASVSGWKCLLSAPMWYDGCAEKATGGEFGIQCVVYPWQKAGSLNNTRSADSSGYKSSLLSKKRLENSRFSYNTIYTSTPLWLAEDPTKVDQDNRKTSLGISGVSIFNSKEITPIKIKSNGEGVNDIIYFGNVDEIINRKEAYDIIVSNYGVGPSASHERYVHQYQRLDDIRVPGPSSAYDSKLTNLVDSEDSIPIKYKSTPHAVLALKNTESNWQKVLPTFRDSFDNQNVNFVGGEFIQNSTALHLFWDENRNIAGVKQDIVTLPDDGNYHWGGGDLQNGYSTRFGFFWLGELYNDNVQNRFGGTTSEAIANNQWVVAGNEISLLENNGSLKTYFDIRWTEGDTYYQRYDCMKTYPSTEEDMNSVIDIISFMCETRMNIDGRYDKYRGTNNLYVSPEKNFNLLNPAYSQQNNFFNYRSSNLERLILKDFPNVITWTKTKTSGEEIDSWTNITLGATLELDGDKGTVRALRRLGDYLFAIQDTGISQILYNDNVQIASTAGVPIEIANSGKVSGKRYISNHIGCTNKWSIYTTNNGMYFIDDITKGIYIFNGQQLTNLSDKLGFHSWMTTNFDDIKIWNPENFDSAVTYYDKINQDLFFITKDNCLGFNENLGNFVSFYSYEHTPYFSNLEDRGIMWQKAKGEIRYRPWMYREGEYNKFFNSYKSYWTTVVVNSEPTVDKIFNNLEFRSDSFDEDTYVPEHTFDHLTVWNEYQKGIAELKNKRDRVSNLQKKFRIWRAIIPRNTENKGASSGKNYSRDRMRNPWLYLKLSAEKENSINRGYKTVLHDLAVDYFE